MKKKEKLEDLEETRIIERVEEKHCCSGNCDCERKHFNNGESLFYKILFVLLAVFALFVVGLGLGGYLTLKDNQDDLTTEKDEVATDSKVSYEVDVNYFEDLINKYEVIDFANKSFDSTEEINEDVLLEFALNNLENKGDSFSLEEVNKLLNDSFGVTIDGKDIPCDVCPNALYKYDADKKIFVLVKTEDGDEVHAHGGGQYINSINKIVSVATDDNVTYTIKVNKVFGTGISVTTDYYASYGDAVKEKNVLYENTDEEAVGELTFNFDNNRDKLLTYTYVFEKVNDNLVLKSYKIGE